MNTAAAAPSLDAVLNHPAIWRGGACARVSPPGVPTGFAELDAFIPGSGWPVGALTEIYAERTGIGEFKLIMPAVAMLTQSGRWVGFVAPPHVPYAPALAENNVRLARLLTINTAADESLWAAEQALSSHCCGAVAMWMNHIHERALRRLQLATETGGSTLFLFRSARVAPASPAALRLHVSRAQNRTIVRILKRRGGGLPAPIALDLHHPVRFAAPRHVSPHQYERHLTAVF
jgi:protein ImuA